MGKNKKLCLACSVGGHLTQMTQLSSLYKNYEYFYVTENTELTRDMAKKEKIYFLKLINRKMLSFVLLFIINTFLSIRILIKEKPDVIISTGVLSAVPICILGKIFGKKLIYIESFAKMDSPTISGRVLYPFADLFIVQWESMLKYYPKAVNGGSIY